MRIRFCFAHTFPNIRYGRLMPPEDSFAMNGAVFAVADGITRDPIRPRNFSGKSMEDLLRHYPNPSGARAAAETFCQTFVRGGAGPRRAVGVRQRFIEANKRIAALNRTHVSRVDYLVRDFWGAVAAGGVIRGKFLSWGAIGDCEVAVFSASGRLRFRSGDGMAAFTSFERRHLQRSGYDWSIPEYRIRVRRDFRNNPTAVWRDRCVGYGALTGEFTAARFMRFGTLRMHFGDLVVCITDGFAPFMRQHEFPRMLNQASEVIADQRFTPWSLDLAHRNPERYGKERTIVAIGVS